MSSNSVNESNFDMSELFFSRTDSRGIIHAYNDIFKRVSEYSSEELYLKPHNLIRHPDTPKAVFKLLWNVISEGRPLCAYVKNKTKTGKFYWVFAMAFPIESGYLSIRLKPSSIYFPKIENLYKQMLTAERGKSNQAELMTQSTNLLVQTVESFQYKSYEDFMKILLVEELKSRDLYKSEQPGTSNLDSKLERLESRDQKNSKAYREVQNCFKISSALFKSVVNLENSMNKFEEITEQTKIVGREVDYFTTNLVISADKFGESGEVLSVVSENFGKLATEINIEVKKLSSSIFQVKIDYNDVKFLAATSRLQVEMLYLFIKDLIQKEILNASSILSSEERVEFSKEASYLKNLVLENIKKIQRQLEQFKVSFNQFDISIQDLASIITGMDVIRITGKIEISRIPDPTNSLDNHVDAMVNLNLRFKNSVMNLNKECQSVIQLFEYIWGDTQKLDKQIIDFDF